MKEKIIYQRDYSAQRAQEEEALRNFVPSKEETEQDKKAYARFKKSLEAAYFERDPEFEKTAMRMVKKAIMLANNFLWDITVLLLIQFMASFLAFSPVPQGQTAKNSAREICRVAQICSIVSTFSWVPRRTVELKVERLTPALRASSEAEIPRAAASCLTLAIVSNM